jgi:hypothetical protein
MENTLKDYKRIWRIRQEYFAVYGEHADRHKTEPITANFRQNPKKCLIIWETVQILMGSIHRTLTLLL